MQTDWNDLGVTTDSPDLVAVLDRCGRGFLSYGDIGDPTAAVSLDPKAPLLLTHLALLALFDETPAGVVRTREWIARARLEIHRGLPREQLWLAAINAWAEGDRAAALSLHQDIARSWPRDLMSLKLGLIHAHGIGDHAAMLALCEATAPANDGRPWFFGLWAFAYEENHRLDEAEACAHRALAITDDDPWAHHALLHVWDARADAVSARDWLTTHRKTWSQGNSFIRSHMDWHLALCALDLGDRDRALEIYRKDIVACDVAYGQNLANAASLLARLDLTGAGLAADWVDLAALAFDHRHDRIDPFLDLHYLIALAKGGYLQAAFELREGIEAMAGSDKRPGHEAWIVAQSLAHGIIAWAQNDLSAAFRAFVPVLPKIGHLGGSHTQRDMFWQIWFYAGHGAGYGAVLRERIAARQAARPAHPLWRALSAL